MLLALLDRMPFLYQYTARREGFAALCSPRFDVCRPDQLVVIFGLEEHARGVWYERGGQTQFSFHLSESSLPFLTCRWRARITKEVDVDQPGWDASLEEEVEVRQPVG